MTFAEWPLADLDAYIKTLQAEMRELNAQLEQRRGPLAQAMEELKRRMGRG